MGEQLLKCKGYDLHLLLGEVSYLFFLYLFMFFWLYYCVFIHTVGLCHFIAVYFTFIIADYHKKKQLYTAEQISLRQQCVHSSVAPYTNNCMDVTV